MTGTQVMSGLIDAGRLLGYLVHHETDSRKTDGGWPDLVIVGHGRVFVVECKSRSERLSPGKLTKQGRQIPGQADWLDAFASALVATYVCRPDGAKIAPPPESLTDWQEIEYTSMLSILRAARERTL